MTTRSNRNRLSILVALAGLALLTGCANQYGPPVEGKPLTWGQQHYLDNQAYQQLNQDRMNN